jgi:hypothetical protein
MRPSNALILVGLALAVGAVQASSRQNTLRISMTIVDRCDIRAGVSPSVDCSTGVPWMVASPTPAHAAPSLVADGTHGTHGSHLPVPHSGPVDGARVTTIVF